MKKPKPCLDTSSYENSVPIFKTQIPFIWSYTYMTVVRAVIKRWRPGIFTGYFQLFSQESRRKIEPKGTPSCLILPPPTCWIYLATCNVRDNPTYSTYIQK